MSSPSKKRLAARAWMSRVTNQHKMEVIAEVRAARDRADREWRDKLTRIIPPDDDGTIYPQGRLEQPYIYVLAPTGVPDYAAAMDLNDIRWRQAIDRPIRVDAKQMAHVLPNGGKLVWWTWEVSR